jgi:hypothetical protein
VLELKDALRDAMLEIERATVAVVVDNAPGEIHLY